MSSLITPPYTPPRSPRYTDNTSPGIHPFLLNAGLPPYTSEEEDPSLRTPGKKAVTIHYG